MSWIFSFLLACYLLVRIVLRVRGQLRWLSIRDSLPTPPTEVSPPTGLPPALVEVLVESHELRVALVHARRDLMIVEVTDPDAALGRVRDARYRRALMESWTRISAWVRGIRELDEHATAVLADLHLGPEAIEQLRGSLRERWRAVARARALDLFELDDLRAVLHTLEQVDRELETIEQGLVRFGDNPYRDRFVGPGCPSHAYA